jgi:hypothetical protein
VLLSNSRLFSNSAIRTLRERRESRLWLASVVVSVNQARRRKLEVVKEDCLA